MPVAAEEEEPQLVDQRRTPEQRREGVALLQRVEVVDVAKVNAVVVLDTVGEFRYVLFGLFVGEAHRLRCLQEDERQIHRHDEPPEVVHRGLAVGHLLEYRRRLAFYVAHHRFVGRAVLSRQGEQPVRGGSPPHGDTRPKVLGARVVGDVQHRHLVLLLEQPQPEPRDVMLISGRASRLVNSIRHEGFGLRADIVPASRPVLDPLAHGRFHFGVHAGDRQVYLHARRFAIWSRVAEGVIMRWCHVSLSRLAGEVHQLTRRGLLVAAHDPPGGPVEAVQAVQAVTAQHTPDRRGGHPGAGRQIHRTAPGAAPQPADPLLGPRRGAPRRPTRTRAAVHQPGVAVLAPAAPPLRHRGPRQAHLAGHHGLRLPRGHPPDHQQPPRGSQHCITVRHRASCARG